MTTERFLFIIIMIVGLILSSYVLATNTNLIFKQEGTEFTKSFNIQPTENMGDGGYIRIRENSLTPSASDWATFENGKEYIYFTINPEDLIEKKVKFKLPEIMEAQKYYVDLEIKYLSGEVKMKTISFRVI